MQIHIYFIETNAWYMRTEWGKAFSPYGNLTLILRCPYGQHPSPPWSSVQPPSHQCPELTCPTLTAPAWQNPRLAGISIKVCQSRHFRAMQQGQYHGLHLHSDNTSISWFSSYPCRFFQVSPGACATGASVLHQGYHRWLCSAPPSGSYWHGLQCGQSSLGGPRPPRSTINSARGVACSVSCHTAYIPWAFTLLWTTYCCLQLSNPDL